MGRISIDYDKAYAESNRLRMIATECQSLYDQSIRALENMGSYWTGAAADEFFASNQRWQREVLIIKNEVETLSLTIKRVADEMRAAEMRTKAAVNGSGGGGGS